MTNKQQPSTAEVLRYMYISRKSDGMNEVVFQFSGGGELLLIGDGENSDDIALKLHELAERIRHNCADRAVTKGT